ncbi:hypothetical protein XSR1_160059 [Xenorhabdus szentirmaii DSM 16338]|uniref:Uncharacterized protein n=1 Tax=Xenorhabdus szentirmaii DSM 16338 TaxID=1427518 RepID=W1ITS3_9GAMM|nr:hypothetical protein XSR1_160059 [Xenorhabdus szentirmaii DSM 16338]
MFTLRLLKENHYDKEIVAGWGISRTAYRGSCSGKRASL